MERIRWSLVLCLLVLAVGPVSGASAAEPPWCGTPQDDAAARLPDGSSSSHPVGSFPHIPYYAIGCTLQDIQSRSGGRMQLEVIGKSALGRDMYGVVINELRTPAQQRDYANWQQVRATMLDDPGRAQAMADGFGAAMKVPIYVQGGIHGNEYEGVDAAIDKIEKYATTPYGQDPVVDEILDHAVLIFNPIQNPDGRIAGTRANGNGFDLNRDFLTQSQSETIASLTLMKRWLAPEMLDMHGYVEPTLIEATTKPHNPSIEYDLWLKWNQARIDYNEAAMDAIGQDVTRPINDWCPEANAGNADGKCDGGETPGPDVAEGWDDWGPFYGPMYSQHVGLDSSTVEMCADTNPAPTRYRACGGRAGARRSQNTVQQSTFEFVVDHRVEMLHDQLEMYRRGDVDAPRPACCPDPFKPEFHNWMHDYPKAYVIPWGADQRSNAEANRLVRWALFNDIEVSKLDGDYTFDGRTFQDGSYVIWMAQPRRGLADTALGIGVDVSDRIQRLYAPPAAWSHGYLWGADIVTIPDGAAFSPATDRVRRANNLHGGAQNGTAGAYALQLDSPTAVRGLNELLGRGVAARLALEPSAAGPAGTAIFGTEPKAALDAVGAARGLQFDRVHRGALPATEPIERVPRIAVLTGAVNQDVWSLRQLGFAANPVSTGTINSAPSDPLANYDLIYNTASGFPAASNTTGRARLASFFANGGGYIGAQRTGVEFLTGSGTPRTGNQVTGLGVLNDSGDGDGYSGIMLWNNAGGASSVVTGAYPAQDTLIADPPTWMTSVPATFTVDGRLPASGFFAAGLWPGSGPASAAGNAVIAHGTNTAGTARMTVFASNPLYRADPEREWPMVGAAAYWADK